MNLILTIINYELYHIEDNLFLVATKYLRSSDKQIAKKARWINNKLVFIDTEFNSSVIPYYFFKRIREFIPNFLEPFHIYDSVVYKDKEYTIVDVKGRAKINDKWVDVISYIPKFGKIKCHREKQEFISKFKKI